LPKQAAETFEQLAHREPVEINKAAPAYGKRKAVLYATCFVNYNKPDTGMVRVEGGETRLQIPGLEGLPPLPIPDYWIGRYEVTNREFKPFVAQGGYTDPRYWREPVVLNGRPLPLSQAVQLFHDKTGRPGPAGWELGEYPAGQDDLPVVGVSWYEAAAFAAFSGGMLPTGYQWSRAAGTRMSAWMIPLSNFSGQALSARGATQDVSPFGVYDLPGNAKEWCWNASGNGRLILGGGFNEPTYMFNDWDTKPPLERAANFGFRLSRQIEGQPVPPASLLPIPTAFRDFRKEKPVSDAVFEIFRSMCAYDKVPLDPVVQPSAGGEDYRLEKVAYHAGYGQERMFAWILLPKTPPPYQTVVMFPGANGLITATSIDPPEFLRIHYLVQTGRAVVYPIYKSTFERRDELHSDHPNTSGLFRDHQIMWTKEFRRTLDYVETRPDLDASKIAFYGLSWGATQGAILPAFDSRVKVLVLESGGLYAEKTLPEVDQMNYAPRVKAPVLMIDGRYDHFFPLETSQLPLLRLFGAPEKDKRHVIVDSSHALSRHLVIKEALPWLDRYLGPVAGR
jgi:dienelactone hydrolase